MYVTLLQRSKRMRGVAREAVPVGILGKMPKKWFIGRALWKVCAKFNSRLGIVRGFQDRLQILAGEALEELKDVAASEVTTTFHYTSRK